MEEIFRDIYIFFYQQSYSFKLVFSKQIYYFVIRKFNLSVQLNFSFDKLLQWKSKGPPKNNFQLEQEKYAKNALK